MKKYRCFQCQNEFNNIKDIFSHLRNIHFVKEKVTQIKCVNNFSSFKCTKTFLTFDGLRKHLDKCYLNGKLFDLKVTNISKNCVLSLRCSILFIK